MVGADNFVMAAGLKKIVLASRPAAASPAKEDPMPETLCSCRKKPAAAAGCAATHNDIAAIPASKDELNNVVDVCIAIFSRLIKTKGARPVP
jgi:hypothetical protein